MGGIGSGAHTGQVRPHDLPAHTSDPGPRGLALGAAGSAAGTVGFAGECQLLRLISSYRLTLRLCAGPTS